MDIELKVETGSERMLQEVVDMRKWRKPVFVHIVYVALSQMISVNVELLSHLDERYIEISSAVIVE